MQCSERILLNQHGLELCQLERPLRETMGILVRPAGLILSSPCFSFQPCSLRNSLACHDWSKPGKIEHEKGPTA